MPAQPHLGSEAPQGSQGSRREAAGIFYVRDRAFLHFTKIAPTSLPIYGSAASGGDCR